MQTYEQNQTNRAPDARDFLGGNYLGKDDLEGSTVVTVGDVREEEVLGARRRKLVAYFLEFDKPLVLNKTNIKALARIFQTSNTGLWRGPVSIYVDPAVEYAGAMVGGIRVRPAQAVALARSDTDGIPCNGHTDWDAAA